MSGSHLDIGLWTLDDCNSCVAQEGFGYCASSHTCALGHIWPSTPSNVSIPPCPLGDYYYQQCQLSTLRLGLVVLTCVCLGVLACVAVILSCCRSRTPPDEDDETQPLFPSRILSLKRSATYYQWNRPYPQTSPQESHANWEQQRQALLQKYGAPSTSQPSLSQLESPPPANK